jgi:hypothetical protein
VCKYGMQNLTLIVCKYGTQNFIVKIISLYNISGEIISLILKLCRNEVSAIFLCQCIRVRETRDQTSDKFGSYRIPARMQIFSWIMLQTKYWHLTISRKELALGLYLLFMQTSETTWWVSDASVDDCIFFPYRLEGFCLFIRAELPTTLL